MARSKMAGPYLLSRNSISELKLHGIIGNYALGFSRNGLFYIQRIEMAEKSIGHELEKWLLNYDQFKFKPAETITEAYLKVCRDFHQFTKSNDLDNLKHPIMPEILNIECPVCGLKFEK